MRLGALITTSGEYTLRDLFVKGRPNSLNLIRLLLASAVIVWHSYAALGLPYPPMFARNLLGALPVNGFFAISGFLIYRSWHTRPVAWDYLVARVVRIYPAFWVCLIATALVFAPVATALQGGNPVEQALSWDSLTYFLKNSSLAMLQWRIGDSPSEIPYTTSWNASLWTLAWEFACYLGLLALGLLGMLSRRWLVPAAFAASIALNVLSAIPPFDLEVLERVARFAIFFLAGAMAAHYSNRVPASRRLTALALLIMIACAWAPSTAIIVQAPATALGLVLLGGVANPSWAQLKNDISYGVYIYAFPTQQLLVVAGLSGLAVGPFAAVSLIATVPLAVASWFLVERPALKLRRRLGYSAWHDRRTRGKS